MDVFVLKDSVTGGMTDAEFLKFCLENPDLRIERNSNLEIMIMSPVTSKYSFYSGATYAQLFNWSISDKRGIAFDSSAGFTLADRSVLSPDASWVSKENWDTLTEEDKNRFAPICPEFIIEVRSKSDDLSDLKKKMKTWLANGAQLAWLVDPTEQRTFIFKPDGSESIIQGFEGMEIKGEGPVNGFILDLSLLKI